MSRFAGMAGSTKIFEISRFSDDHHHVVPDVVSVEEPLEIQIILNGKVHPVSVTMRTPGNDSELAVGFLFTEAIIHNPDEIESVNNPEPNKIQIELIKGSNFDPTSLARNFYVNSSCGVCGKASIDSIQIDSKRLCDTFSINSEILKSLPSKIITAQQNFTKTGGIHASALFDAKGNLQVLYEDIGRHNALDKVIGDRFMKKEFPLAKTILLVSGRLSFELVQKAILASIPVVAAIGAPSSLAVELAQEKGITLVGFLNEDRFNVYSNQNRIS